MIPMSIVLILTRTQTWILVLTIWILIIIFESNKVISYFYHNRIKSFVMTLGMLACVSLISFGFLFNTIRTSSISSQLITAVSGRTRCLMEYEDRTLFTGEEQEIFDFIYEKADSEQHLKKYFRNDLWRATDIAYHTNKNTGECIDVIRDFYHDKYPDLPQDAYALEAYSVNQKVTLTLLKAHIVDYIRMTFELMSQSLVSSIFIQPDVIHNLCFYVTCLIYIFALISYLCACRCKIGHKYTSIITYVSICLLSNVFFTNLFFYGQQRYVIYTFGLFYISVYILVLGIIRQIISNRQGNT